MRTARKTASSFFAHAVLAVGPALLLAACDSAKPVRDRGETAGEVLPGTISDDMIPLDQLRSQGEPLKPEDAATDAAEGSAAPRAKSAPSQEAAATEPVSEPAADAAGDAPDEG
ncbi:MAG TPA: hypothetical protein VHN58_10425 [Croceicoccus sp.]|nr:hypothetical protein [Croceicoccus sp.]